MFQTCSDKAHDRLLLRHSEKTIEIHPSHTGQLDRLFPEASVKKGKENLSI